jgi:iron only hydrogenase large subunit-like protein
MIATAKWIKAKDADALVAFIGPCFAKKGEAEHEGRAIDFVLTFEELSALLTGADIQLAQVQPESEYQTTASHDGNAFACAGGVASAVESALSTLYPEQQANITHCEGLGECLKELKAMRDKKSSTTLLEGMACTGGCVGGPGSLLNSRVTRIQVEKYSLAAANKHSFENADAVVQAQETSINWHTHHQD